MIVEELAAKLGLKIDEGAWERGAHAVEGLKEHVESLHETVMHAVEAFAIFEGVKIFKEWVEGTVEAAVGAKRLGERVGLTSEAVQELGYAADVTGASGEHMTIGMQHLAKGLQELRTKGTGPAVDGLHALKISLNDPDIRHGKVDQVLEVIANRFAKMPDGVAKTSAAMDLFGREGASLIPLLNRGASGIKELREEAKKLGVVIDEDGINKAEEFEESQKRLKGALTGLKNEAVTALLPELTKMADGMLKWVKANQDFIKSKIQEIIPVIVKGLQLMGKALLFVITALGWMQKHLLLTSLAVGALLVIFAPVLAVVTAIGLAVYELYDGIVNGKGPVAAAVDWIKDEFAKLEWFIDDLFNKIMNKANGVMHWIQDHVVAIANLGGGSISAVTKAGGSAIDAGVNADNAAHDQRVAARTLPSVARSQQNSASIGDTHITIHTGSGDPKQIASMVKTEVQSAQKDMLRQAMSSVKGSKK